MQKISTQNYFIEFGLIEDSSLGKMLTEYEGRNKVIIVDENTNEHCLPRLISHFESLANAEIINTIKMNKQLAYDLNYLFLFGLVEKEGGREDKFKLDIT